MTHQSILDYVGNTPLVRLNRLFMNTGLQVSAKLEFFNPGGSVKDRPAKYIIEHGLRTGEIKPTSHIIESTSGNFGIALAMVARAYNLAFTAVVDPKILPANIRMLQAFGAQIDMVTQCDEHNGYLLTRLRRVNELLGEDEDKFWINQYANPLNWQTHYHTTANEIVEGLEQPIDYFFGAVSTTGTLMGIGRRLREAFPSVKIIAVDATGSIIFGNTAGSRDIPGIGASRVPELLDTSVIDEVVLINDYESATACRSLLLHEGIFAGGSSGAVIAAIQKLQPSLPAGSRIATLLPDRGERYLDLVYNDAWYHDARERWTVSEPQFQPIEFAKVV